MIKYQVPDDFCIFILTHGRPDNIRTYKSLKKAGYTGKIYIVLDNEDKKTEEYKARFGAENVLVFDKAKYAELMDEGNNFQEGRRSICYARNACWEMARLVGCKYFCQMDDDYNCFFIRYNKKREFISGYITSDFDQIIIALLDFYKISGAEAIAMAQGGDYIGGGESKPISLLRKCMNSWICDVDKPLRFPGYMNEDVSLYTLEGRRGKLFFTVKQAMLTQEATQSSVGELSQLYKDVGTYVKSFYTILYAPSCVQIGFLKNNGTDIQGRIHHKINWHKACAKIVSSDWKKGRIK